jgi:serine/threonine protein kinase
MSKMKTFSEIINEINKEKIGFGGFGDVYKFEYDGKIYALKQIKLEKLSENEKKSYEKEAKFLSKFNNEYIVKYYDSFTKDNKFYIIMEYGGKTLKKFIDNKKYELIEPETINSLIKQISLGLKGIHDAGITHRDLKPANIFIDENLRIKIGDFGVSTSSNYFTTQIGTQEYEAPELQVKKKSGDKFSNKVDIYSLGCIFYELFTLRNYYGDKQYNSIEEINTNFYDKKWQKLINLMLSLNPDERPNIEQIFNYLD